VKVLTALALILCVVSMPDTRLWIFLVYLGLLLALFSASRLPAGFVARRAAWFGPFVASAVLFLPFTRRGGGTVLAAVSILGLPVALYREGARAAAAVFLKSTTSGLAVVLLVSTTPLAEVLRALEWMRVPRTLVSVISLLSRYLLLLRGEVTSVTRAARSRAWESAKVRRRVAAAGGIVGSLFLRTYDRAERVHRAMLARGGEGAFRAPRFNPLGVRDWAVVAGFSLLVLAPLVLALLAARVASG
jgi:cobalt/nickel transport system permease protein